MPTLATSKKFITHVNQSLSHIKNFVEKVQQWWNEYCFMRSPSFNLAWKFKALKDDLKKWNKEEFGDLAFRKKNLLFELLDLDAREDLLGVSRPRHKFIVHRLKVILNF